MLSKELVDSYKVWFDNYIKNFRGKHPEFIENIDIKADHCKKVSSEIVALAQSLSLSNEDMLLAEIIGLFHDIGRFRQYAKYQTFSDSKSQNHAELGVEVLKENNVLNDLSAENQEIIYNSILNHSKAEIIPDKNERVTFFAKLIRDADKLDIWRLITEYYMVKEQKKNKALELELPDNDEISDEVLESILNKKLVLKESMKTLNDFKLLQIGWIFDLNFDYSIKQLYEKKYLDRIFDSLPANEKIYLIKNIVNDYFKTRIETSVNI
jgi:putative nucleotidyltransferase with HDIG domain